MICATRSRASVPAGGLSLPIIGQLLGHTQSRTTQRYAHLADDPVREAEITTVISNAGRQGADASMLRRTASGVGPRKSSKASSSCSWERPVQLRPGRSPGWHRARSPNGRRGDQVHSAFAGLPEILVQTFLDCGRSRCDHRAVFAGCSPLYSSKLPLWRCAARHAHSRVRATVGTPSCPWRE